MFLDVDILLKAMDSKHTSSASASQNQLQVFAALDQQAAKLLAACQSLEHHEASFEQARAIDKAITDLVAQMLRLDLDADCVLSKLVVTTVAAKLHVKYGPVWKACSE